VAEEKFLTLLPCSAKVSNQKLSDAEAESTAPRGKNNKITRLRGIEASQYTSRGNQQSEQDDHDIYPTRLSQEDRQISARWIAKTFFKKKQHKSRIPLPPLHSPGPHKQHLSSHTDRQKKGENEWRNTMN
jgi:hypothetical protein